MFCAEKIYKGNVTDDLGLVSNKGFVTLGFCKNEDEPASFKFYRILKAHLCLKAYIGGKMAAHCEKSLH